MSIRVYKDYQEFKYEEKDLHEFFEDQSFNNNDYEEEEEDYQFFSEFSGYKINVVEDANYYIVCDDEDEELSEEIAEFLGKSTKTILEDFRKIFFYIV
jgi:hypothetical protein